MRHYLVGLVIIVGMLTIASVALAGNSNPVGPDCSVGTDNPTYLWDRTWAWAYGFQNGVGYGYTNTATGYANYPC